MNRYIVTYTSSEDGKQHYAETEARTTEDAEENVISEYWDVEEIISVMKV